MKHVVAISGYKGSGKDTAALHLINNYGYTRLAFADLLKDLAAEEYGFPREYADLRDRKEEPIPGMGVVATDAFTKDLFKIIEPSLYKDSKGYFWTPRALCILKGSVNRLVHPDYWVHRVVSEIKNSNHNRFVITDLRYESEIKCLNKFLSNLTLIRINREASTSTDASERDLDNFVFENEIDNTGTIQELYDAVDTVVNVRGLNATKG